MKKDLKIVITEIFTAKAGRGNTGFDRCFHGTIRRTDGVVYGKIFINGGYILAKERDQWALGENLDDIVLLILDKGIHDNKGVFFSRYGFEYNLN